jgi:hypothetical protein
METIQNAEQVKFDLSEQADEGSTVRVRTEIGGAGEPWATREVSVYTHADPEEGTLWVNISQHTYASVEMFGDTLSTNVDLISHRFTREQAEALLKVLQHEVAKF